MPSTMELSNVQAHELDSTLKAFEGPGVTIRVVAKGEVFSLLITHSEQTHCRRQMQDAGSTESSVNS